MEKLRIVGITILVEYPEEFFTLDQLVEVTKIDRIFVRRILEKFIREKFVIQIAKKPSYQLSLKKWVEPSKGRPPLAITYRAKSIAKLTERVKPKQRENTAQDKMWSVIRNKSKVDGNFTMRDVVVLAEVKRENARWYLKQLRRAGIVRASGVGGPGVTWTLIKDCGPRRPSISKQ